MEEEEEEAEEEGCRSAHGTMIKTLTDCLRHMRLKHDNPLSPCDVFLYHVLEECGIK